MEILEKIEIRKITSHDTIPWNLLLSADPAKPLIVEYLKEGIVYIGLYEKKIIGVYILLRINDKQYELKNIAVDCNYQGKGIGKKLVFHAIETARNLGATVLEVGTGNSSLSQLALYQKCNFRMSRIEKDFFTKNYKNKIIENGIECKDMIYLSLEL